MPAATAIADKVRPVLERYRDRIAFAYLFGSSLFDRVGTLSDIDLAVYVSNTGKTDFLDFKFTLYADFCRVLERNDVDVVVLNSVRNILLLENIVKEGLVIFETAEGKDLREDFALKVRHQAIDFLTQRKRIMGG
jgi:uncharacterized protein